MVKRTGDGALVEFRSVVDAVRCAIEIQHAMVERNLGVPADRRIEFRIGVHLGDVVEESDGDLMGDGVNIAARLEGVAQPGAICLSEDAYRQVRARLDLAVAISARKSSRTSSSRCGSTRFKSDGRAQAKAARRRLGDGRASRRAGKAIHRGAAVPEHERRGRAGLFLLTDWSRTSSPPCRSCELLVIARNSSFVYKGRSVDVREVATQLGVRYVLEGSVRKSGARSGSRRS